MLRQRLNVVWVLSLVLGLNACGTPAPLDRPVVAAPDAESRRAQCLAHTTMHASTAAVTHRAREFEEFLHLSEQALVWRQQALELVGHLNGKRNEDAPLTGAELEQLHTGTLAYLDMRQKLWALASLHECWLDLSPERLAGIDPVARDDGMLLSLSAALLLYDNYLLTVALYDQDGQLRRTLNRPEKGFALPRNRLAEVKSSYYSPENSARVQSAIARLKPQIHAGVDANTPPERAYLLQLIAQSPSYVALEAGSLPVTLAAPVRELRMLTSDLLNGISREGLNLASMVFGNSVGLVETRRGKLYRQPVLEKRLASQMQPGDILLEKTPFRLTDLMIPGYWGHAAIWVGSESELRALGLWEHEAVRPHHAAIRKGKRIVEALRSGVVLNSLAHFMNVDDLAVLRAVEPVREQQVARVLRAFRQLGKAYDFNFDVETTDRIVCSELIYQTYTEMPWPTSRQLGRATISPDQVALRAVNGGPLRAVALVVDGRWVENAHENRLAQLLGQPRPLAQAERTRSGR